MKCDWNWDCADEGRDCALGVAWTPGKVSADIKCDGVTAGCFEDGDDNDEDESGVCGGSAGLARKCGVENEPPAALVAVSVDADIPTGFSGENADAFAAVGVDARSTRE